jgi:hypothetical protein
MNEIQRFWGHHRRGCIASMRLLENDNKPVKLARVCHGAELFLPAIVQDNKKCFSHEKAQSFSPGIRDKQNKALQVQYLQLPARARDTLAS